MDISNKQTLVCYIESNKALFYYGVAGVILPLDFSPDVISDLELTNSLRFEQLIDAFLKTNKLLGGVVIFIFSQNTAFEKDFPDEMSGKKDEEIQEFINIIPFEDVLSRIYKLNKKTKVVVINKQIYESVKKVFEKNNYSVLAVVPSIVLKETFEELSQNEDLAFIASKIYSLKQYSMLEVNEAEKQNIEKKPEVKNKNLRPRILITTLVILLIILIGIVIVNLLPKQSSKDLPVVVPSFSPSPTPTGIILEPTSSIFQIKSSTDSAQEIDILPN